LGRLVSCRNIFGSFSPTPSGSLAGTTRAPSMAACLVHWRWPGCLRASTERSPFGAPDFTPLVARVCRTPFSERSTAKLQALAWRPSGSCHRTCQRADDLGIAIPLTTERLWPAHKFQDFLRLSRRSDHHFTTSLGKRTKSPQLSREKLEDY